MTGRDRIVIMAVAALGVLAAVWFLGVSPKRQQAAELGKQVSSEQAQLATARSQVSSAQTAQAQYSTDYASIIRLGKAVPASAEVPSLVYQLAQASGRRNVEFSSITAGASGSSGGSSGASAASSSSSSSSASSAAGASAASAGFSQMPFTFVFSGNFNSLYHLFQQLNHFTLHTASGGLEVSGRLLTIQSVQLQPNTSVSSGKEGGHASEQLTGTITATAYVLPAGQGLTGGATPSGPGGATQTVSGSGSPSSANPPAVAQVTP
ncbi:MAG TPA: type II secretion system protein GspM [Solirubrobacteraceae bacterium]|nr:type II secretion system protein GspM [Solirubrobacteraceae bacterium]